MSPSAYTAFPVATLRPPAPCVSALSMHCLLIQNLRCCKSPTPHIDQTAGLTKHSHLVSRCPSGKSCERQHSMPTSMRNQSECHGPMHAWSRQCPHVRLASTLWAPQKMRGQHRPPDEVIGPSAPPSPPGKLLPSRHCIGAATCTSPPLAAPFQAADHFLFHSNTSKRSDALPASGCSAAGRSVGAARAPTGGQQPG